MAKFLDSIPAHKTIQTSLGEFEIQGLGIDGIAHLIRSHPDLLKVIQNGFDYEKAGLQFSDVMNLGVDIVADFLAAGLGYVGNPEAVERCKKLNPEDAMKIGEAILLESFPSGPSSFLDKLMKNKLIQMQLEQTGTQTEQPATQI